MNNYTKTLEIMKRILTVVSAVFLLGTYTAAAQIKKVEVSKKIVELTSTLHVDVTLVDALQPGAIIEIPSGIAQQVVCDVDGETLSIYSLHEDEATLKKLSADNPIKVSIGGQDMRCINNSGIMRLTYNNRRLDGLEINNSGIMNWEDDRFEIGYLKINNAGVYHLGARKITADSIEINNSGRYSCSVHTFYCKRWEHNNNGMNDIESAVEAETIECNSSGREQLQLDVACEQLRINSTGVGKMTFIGTADNINVSSTGMTKISTSEVNTK